MHPLRTCRDSDGKERKERKDRKILKNITEEDIGE